MKISGFVVILQQGPYGDPIGTKIPYINLFEHFLKKVTLAIFNSVNSLYFN